MAGGRSSSGGRAPGVGEWGIGKRSSLGDVRGPSEDPASMSGRSPSNDGYEPVGSKGAEPTAGWAGASRGSGACGSAGHSSSRGAIEYSPDSGATTSAAGQPIGAESRTSAGGSSKPPMRGATSSSRARRERRPGGALGSSDRAGSWVRKVGAAGSTKPPPGQTSPEPPPAPRATEIPRTVKPPRAPRTRLHEPRSALVPPAG